MFSYFNAAAIIGSRYEEGRSRIERAIRGVRIVVYVILPVGVKSCLHNSVYHHVQHSRFA